MAFEMDDLAQQVLADHPVQRQEIGIPAPVLKHRQHPPRTLRRIPHPPSIAKRRRYRLFDQHVLARIERRDRMVCVRIVRTGNDHQLDAGFGQKRLHRRDHGHSLQAVVDLRGIAGDNRTQRQTLGRFHEGRMKYAPTQSESDKANPDSRHLASLLLACRCPNARTRKRPPGVNPTAAN